MSRETWSLVLFPSLNKHVTFAAANLVKHGKCAGRLLPVHVLQLDGDKLLSCGLCRWPGIVAQVFEKRRQGVWLAVVLDLAGFGKVHEVLPGPSQAVTRSAERRRVTERDNVRHNLFY